MKKIAVIGTGKTGSAVLDLLKKQAIGFNSRRKVSFEELKEIDNAIAFLPPNAMLENIDLLISAKINVVTGTTGLEWPSDLDNKLKDAGLIWIKAANFSIAMNLVQAMIKKIANAKTILSQFNLDIHEIHHTKKLDSPSGTALKWKEWVNQEIPVTSERIGDEVGTHILTIKNEFEQIKIEHNSLNRLLFAKGAIFALEHFINTKSIDYGLHSFEELILNEL